VALRKELETTSWIYSEISNNDYDRFTVAKEERIMEPNHIKQTFSDLTVVLPTLNEQGNIEPLIRELTAVLPGVSIIVVDDSSSDGTPGIVSRIAESLSCVTLLERSGKPCLTKSIMTGIQTSQTEYVAWMDADFSHPPKVLRELYALANGGGCAIATRYGGNNDAPGRQQNDTLLASSLSLLLNFFVHVILRLPVTDYTSGFIVCRRNLIADHTFVGDYGEYFIELVYFLDRSGIKIKELPYTSPPRHAGKSKTGSNIFKLTTRGIKYLWLVMRLSLSKRVFKGIGLGFRRK
jgi:dolichol-phosphate mannosyltransferase